MALKSTFRRSEIGEIPFDWGVKDLQALCRNPITYGIVQCGPHIPDGIPYIRVSDMQTNELRIDGMLRTSSSIANRFPRSKVEEGDIVYALRGKLGEVRRIHRTLAGSNLTQGTARISPNESINSEYLIWAMRDRKTIKQAELESKGTTFSEITLADLRKIKIPIPLWEEQDTIAKALNDADAYIESLEQLIAKKRLIKQGVMQELLTGKRRLPGLSGEWEHTQLSAIANLYQPVTISAALFTKDGFPVYGANGIVGHYYNYNHEKWQVTVTCRGSTCGTVNRTEGKSWITGNAMVINCDDNKRISKLFLYYSLLNTDLSKTITGTGQPQIVREPLARVKLDIPIDVNEQIEIASVLNDIDQEITGLDSQLKKARQIKQGMMQELLTGRIRLV
jgi:type I restriction enzyme, S subunit